MLHPISNSQNNPVHEFFTNKKWTFVRHFILILIVLANFELLDYSGFKQYAKMMNVSFKAIYIGNFFSAIFAILFIYINLYFLFPKYLKKGFYLKYVIGIFVLLFSLFLVMNFTSYIYVEFYGKKEDYMINFSPRGFIQTMTYPFVFLGSTTGYKFFKTWIEDQKTFADLQQEKLKSELNQLKNQVNPHFLFNTLNNLHVLIQTNPEKASQITLGLSDVLRYQIYDSQYDKVVLAKEIDLILQYLELEKIRRDNLKTNVKVQGKMTGVVVPPLLFINFIDNAIKHCNTRGNAIINLYFKVENDFLYFEITNTKWELKKENSEKGGFGLVNVTKRLDLLFGETYNLNIIPEEKLYSVELKFPI